VEKPNIPSLGKLFGCHDDASKGYKLYPPHQFAIHGFDVPTIHTPTCLPVRNIPGYFPHPMKHMLQLHRIYSDNL